MITPRAEATDSRGGGKATSVPVDRSRTARMAGGVAGVGFTVLYLLGNSGLASLPGAPTGSETDEDLARYFYESRGGVLLFAALVLLSCPLLTWFAYTLRCRLLVVGRARARLAGEVVVGAGVAASSIIGCAMLLIVSAAERSSGELLPPDTLGLCGISATESVSSSPFRPLR